LIRRVPSILSECISIDKRVGYPTAAALYFGMDAFYPGGWVGYANDYEQLQKANQQILGERFITAPFGALKQ
jgi:hypothetical protein